MNDKVIDRQHIYSNGCDNRCGECVECCLTVCTACGELEGGLTTHCPGNRETAGLHDAYSEPWDFRHGEWISGIWTRNKAWRPAFTLYNELKYLEYLQKDAEGNKGKTLEVLNYLKSYFCKEFVEVSAHSKNKLSPLEEQSITF